MAVQTVKLTFQAWDYTAEFTVPVGGNCRGLDVIRTAVGRVYDDHASEHRIAGRDHYYASLVLKRPAKSGAGEDELICDDEEEEGEDWLEGMLVRAEIIDIQPKLEAKL